MSNSNKQLLRYSISFKQKVVREIEQEGLGIDEARRRYGIHGSHTIQRWIRKFGKYQLLNQIIRIETMDERDRIKALEEELKRAKIALAESLLAQRCLETIIAEADKAYKTDLKKSFGKSASPKTQRPST
jgi:transposase